MALLRRRRHDTNEVPGAGGQPSASRLSLEAVAPPPADAIPVVDAAGDIETTCTAEQLDVATAWHPGQRLRVRRRVIVEQVQRTIEVRREVLEVEPLELTAADRVAAALAPATAAGPASIELTLHREEPVIERRVVAYERVSVGRAMEVDERVLREQLRREELGLERRPAPQGAAVPPRAVEASPSAL